MIRPGWTLQISDGANVVFQNQRCDGWWSEAYGKGAALSMIGPAEEASLIVKDGGTMLTVKDNVGIYRGAILSQNDVSVEMVAQLAWLIYCIDVVIFLFLFQTCVFFLGTYKNIKRRCGCGVGKSFRMHPKSTPFAKCPG